MYQFTLALEMRACPQICLLSHISKSRSHWKSSQAAQAPRRHPTIHRRIQMERSRTMQIGYIRILNRREEDDTLLDDRKRQLKERRNRWQPVSKLTIRQNCENTKATQMEDNSYARSVGEEPNNEAFVVKDIIRPQTKSLRQHQYSTQLGSSCRKSARILFPIFRKFGLQMVVCQSDLQCKAFNVFYCLLSPLAALLKVPPITLSQKMAVRVR